MKIIGGHFTYLDVETSCPLCKRIVRCHFTATPIKDFPKRVKFTCRQLACTKEWWKIIHVNVDTFQYQVDKSFWRKLKELFFG